MNPILIAALVVAAIGALCALMLVLASKFFAVEEDERYGKIRACLPGANCGACGYAGCDGYAKALNEGEGIKSNLCIPGGDGAAKQIAEILGVEFEDVFADIVKSNIEKGLLERKQRTLRLTRSGLDIANIVIEDFL